MAHQHGSAKQERLYPPASKRKEIPLSEVADGTLIGRSPEGAKRYRERLKKAPPLKRGVDY